MRISDWSSDVCSSDLPRLAPRMAPDTPGRGSISVRPTTAAGVTPDCDILFLGRMPVADRRQLIAWVRGRPVLTITDDDAACIYGAMFCLSSRSEEHTSELQSLMRISYAVFCLKKKKKE